MIIIIIIIVVVVVVVVVVALSTSSHCYSGVLPSSSTSSSRLEYTQQTHTHTHTHRRKFYNIREPGCGILKAVLWIQRVKLIFSRVLECPNCGSKSFRVLYFYFQFREMLLPLASSRWKKRNYLAAGGKHGIT
jgi:hypothetical protein